MTRVQVAANDAKKQLWLFAGFALVLIGGAYGPILREGSLGALDGLGVMLVMWAPGAAALAARLVATGSLRGLGWGPGRPALLALALVLPALYALPVYAPVWLSGLATFDTAGWQAVAGKANPLSALGLILTLGLVQTVFTAAGEEIGWRGLLVPQLARICSFRRVWAISALVWLAYHVPLIIAADYHAEGSPRGWQLACFALLVAGMSGIMAWLRLASDSLWPPVLLHASHNLLIQGVFDTAVLPGRYSAWITGEFGIGLAVTAGICAWVLAAGSPARLTG